MTIDADSQINLTDHPHHITRKVTLIGLGGAVNRPQFDGAGQYTGLRGVSLTAQVTLENLAFSNHKNYSATSGGAVFARHIGGIKNSRFTDNQSLRAGAAVSSSDFIGNMTDVEFSGNVVDSTGETDLTSAHGGALRVQSFTGDIVDATFSNNRVRSDDETKAQSGGAAYILNMTGNIISSTFDNNRLEGAIAGTKMSGALHVRNLIGNIEKSVFTNNYNGITSDFDPSATGNRSLGGAVSIFNLHGNISDSHFEGNTTPHAGGAMHIMEQHGATNDDFGEIRNSDFINNRAEWGGAIAYNNTNADFSNSKVRLINNRFVGNQVIALEQTFESDNAPPPTGTSDSRYVAAYGGAVYIQNDAGEFEFINNAFVDNSALSMRTKDNAGGYGGAIALLASKSDVHATIAAVDGGVSLFYGNRHNAGNAADTTGTPNSIYFGNNNASGHNRTASATFHVDAYSQLLMLDPMASQPDDFTMLDKNDEVQTFPKLKAVVNKTGAGEWVLGGANDLKGESVVTIEQGTVTLATVDYGGSTGEVAASIDLSHEDSSFTLGKDAVLGGSGTIKADTIRIDGTVDPGIWKTTITPDEAAKAIADAIANGAAPDDAVDAVAANVSDTSQSSDFGTIEIVADDITFGEDSVYVANISDSGDSDTLKITAGDSGSATVTIEDGAELVINSQEPITWEVGKDYAILEVADNVTVEGNFDVDMDVSFDASLGTPELLQPNIVITKDGVQLVMERDEAAFNRIAQSSGQAGMGSALLELPADHAVTTAIVQATSVETARSSFDNLSGEIHSSTHSVLLGNTSLRNVMGARIQAKQSAAYAMGAVQPVMLASTGTAPVSSNMLRQPDTQVWANTWGFRGRINATTAAAKVDTSGMGLSAGVDLGESGGVMVAFEDSKVKNDAARNSRSDVKAYSVGGYLGTSAGNINVRGGVAYSYLDINSTRNIWVPGLTGQLKADYKGHKVQAFVEGSTDVEVGSATLSPYAGVTQVWLRTKNAREAATGNAAPAALNILGKSDSVTLATVGVRAAVALSSSKTTVLYGDLGWQRAFGDTKANTTNRFANTNAQFAAQGVGVGKNRALVGAGVQAQLAPNASISLGYQGQFGSGARDHVANLQVKIRF